METKKICFLTSMDSNTFERYYSKEIKVMPLDKTLYATM